MDVPPPIVPSSFPISYDSSSPFALSHYNNSCTINKASLFWNKRLGHLPFHKMKFIPCLSDNLSNSQSFYCDVCPKARQHRLLFPLSSIHSSSPFQLVTLIYRIITTHLPIMVFDISYHWLMISLELPGLTF